ncbi:hypothetical protein KCP69_20865 [Salmonella enterica subsp. enterica]|nr:hypothetical protein KCP69_20865 [Salmonella enterica subsp. enterica]
MKLLVGILLLVSPCQVGFRAWGWGCSPFPQSCGDAERVGARLTPIAPHWGGNEVWLDVALGGALFATAWFAAAFSGFYVAMI